MKTSDMITGLCDKISIYPSELCRRIGRTPMYFGMKLKRDTVTLEEFKQMADFMGVALELSFF